MWSHPFTRQSSGRDKRYRMKILERVFFRRPRILNLLHKWRLVGATSQTNEAELAALAHHASGLRIAVEIGTYQGVSAAKIAAALSPEGVLFCVDPWPEANGRANPGFEICKRHFFRTSAHNRIRVIRGFSGDVADQLPTQIEFAFIDGDHSWSGIETDWNLVASRLVTGGIVCLHDTAVPESELWRQLDSTRFYEERIAPDTAFETVETVHSMRVVRKMDRR
jgi:predicted O-methyltransferase YrrM